VITLSERDVEAIVLGGGFFGGGGGGEVSEGLRIGRLVLELGDLRIVGLDEVPEGLLHSYSIPSWSTSYGWVR
jgi:DUF917 family protein